MVHVMMTNLGYKDGGWVEWFLEATGCWGGEEGEGEQMVVGLGMRYCEIVMTLP